MAGPETLDDAAVLRLRDDLAVCFTADIITPLVDDPATWGRIAAANSLSDIYAMGATPLAALNLVGWPDCLPVDLLAEVLAGGAAVAAEAGCLVVGGHTIKDREPKYGMAVLGTVHPQRVLRNRGARPGDLLYLTKPLGTGILATAIKAGVAAPHEIEAAVAGMTALSRAASEAACAAGARALTDVTGFGLAGHLCEMLGPGGELGAEVSLAALPSLPGVIGHAQAGRIPGGAYSNREAYAARVRFAPEIPEDRHILLFDPQTSGGLLAAIPPASASSFERESNARAATVHRIGRFTATGRIEVVW
jgi:selenide,water dikinase